MQAFQDDRRGSYSCNNVGVNAAGGTETRPSSVSDCTELEIYGIYLLGNKCFHSETERRHPVPVETPHNASLFHSTTISFAYPTFFYKLVSCIYILLLYCEAHAGLDEIM
jgi:hypothetical protein